MKKSLLLSASAFSAATVAAKVIGVFYRIPLNNLLGADGMGLYQAVFPLFSALLAICGGFVTNAVARLTACHPNARSSDIMRAALIPILLLSLATFALLSLLSKPIASLQGNSQLFMCYLAIAPSLLFVGMIAAFRGYLQGEGGFIQSGVCLLIEQGAKTAFGIALAVWLSRFGAVTAAVGALVGVSLSEIVALLYVFIVYKRKSKARKNRTQKTTIKPLRREVLSFAIPVALGALVIPITQFIESGIILNRLSAALYGLYSGTAATLLSLPSAVSVSAANTVMPELAAEKPNSTREYHTATRAALIFSLAAAAAFIVLPLPIMTILYSHGLSANDLLIAANILRIEGISVLFLTVSQMSSAVLQSKGKTKITAVAAAAGACVKLAVLLPLVNNFGIYGAAVSSVFSSVFSAIINTVCARKILSPIIKFSAELFKAAFAVGAACVVSYLLGQMLLGVLTPFYAFTACICLYATLFIAISMRSIAPKSTLFWLAFPKKKTLIKTCKTDKTLRLHPISHYPL